MNLNKESRKTGKRASGPLLPSCIPAFLMKKSKKSPLFSKQQVVQKSVASQMR
jgi:hypothetical protein